MHAGHVGMFEPSVGFDIQMVSGFRNVLFGGEGLFLATLTGPGHIWLQSMPILNLAEEIARYLPRRRRGREFGCGDARDGGGARRGGRPHRRALRGLLQLRGRRNDRSGPLTPLMRIAEALGRKQGSLLLGAA